MTTFYGSYFWNDRANFPLLKKVANIKMWQDEKWFQGLVLGIKRLSMSFYLNFILTIYIEIKLGLNLDGIRMKLFFEKSPEKMKGVYKIKYYLSKVWILSE